ncbi:MAG TPA: ankyrin repeat domain-containing protein [Alphaproteobacteria bacterium]|nr:ankyrin repeat domain-containing protein [Alphaproteobacteria bacterium]
MSQQQETLNNLLIEAVRSRDVAQAKLYVQKGADPNCRAGGIQHTVRHSTVSSVSQSVRGPLLQLAAMAGQGNGGFSRDMADFLLSAGARIDDKNDSGDSVLMMGIKGYSEAMVSFWLSRGADPMTTDKNGDIALTVASRIDQNSSARQNIINGLMSKMPDQKAQNKPAAATAAAASAAPAPAAAEDIDVMKPATVIARRAQKPRGGGGFAL